MDVILYRTRRMSQSVAREVARLRAEAPDHEVAVVAYQHDYTSADGDPDRGLFCYGARDLEMLPYPDQLMGIDFRKPTGRHDLPVLKYFLAHPQFSNYWVIEDDVRWTGSWGHFFSEMKSSRASLLATTVQTQAQNPDWHWWSSLNTAGERIPELVKCFGPLMRASVDCLRQIDEKYRAGWSGHFECTWPTICHASGFEIQDIGGSGAFTPPKWRYRFYRNSPDAWNLAPGTFIWRPGFHEADFAGLEGHFANPPYLWHPVRE